MTGVTRILIANRGEIALRIIRAARSLGIGTVAIHSTADAGSLHVRLADQSICIGPGPAAESYLDSARIIRAARLCGADAIHPGYGFLSENAGFARAVQAAGLTFIGPSPDCIEEMGDKIRARRTMDRLGIPCIPGTQQALGDPKEAAAIAERVGYPVILKAAGGGGGRGMRVVQEAAALADAMAVTSEEAARAFGSGAIYLERYLETPRHIEIQVLGDAFGHAVWLGERDCSLQRRHQKVLEEAPAPGLDPALIAEVGAACAKACVTMGYTGAGTFEFLVEGGRFAFIEMNTRIQVEHTITEALTGIDIVAEQIRIAQGLPLSVTQSEISPRGAAMELRINAEDAAGRPSAGRVTGLRLPGGPGVRVETHLAAGTDVPPYYDSMIAKLVISGRTRGEVIARARVALGEMEIAGVSTNAPLHHRILSSPGFLSGGVDIHFLKTLLKTEERAA